MNNIDKYKTKWKWVVGLLIFQSQFTMAQLGIHETIETTKIDSLLSESFVETIVRTNPDEFMALGRLDALQESQMQSLLSVFLYDDQGQAVSSQLYSYQGESISILHAERSDEEVYVLAGVLGEFKQDFTNYLLLNLSLQGELNWAKEYDLQGKMYNNDVYNEDPLHIIEDNSVLITNEQGRNMQLTKLDAQGNFLWAAQYLTSTPTKEYSLHEYEDGYVLYQPLNFSHYPHFLYLNKDGSIKKARGYQDPYLGMQEIEIVKGKIVLPHQTLTGGEFEMEFIEVIANGDSIQVSKAIHVDPINSSSLFFRLQQIEYDSELDKLFVLIAEEGSGLHILEYSTDFELLNTYQYLSNHIQVNHFEVAEDEEFLIAGYEREPLSDSNSFDRKDYIYRQLVIRSDNDRVLPCMDSFQEAIEFPNRNRKEVLEELEYRKVDIESVRVEDVTDSIELVSPEYLTNTCDVASREMPFRSAFQVYPNPTTSGTFTLQVQEGVSLKTINIFSSDGKKVAEYELPAGKSQVRLNIPNSAPGLYYIVCYGPDRVYQLSLAVGL